MAVSEGIHLPHHRYARLILSFQYRLQFPDNFFRLNRGTSLPRRATYRPAWTDGTSTGIRPFLILPLFALVFYVLRNSVTTRVNFSKGEKYLSFGFCFNRLRLVRWGVSRCISRGRLVLTKVVNHCTVVDRTSTNVPKASHLTDSLQTLSSQRRRFRFHDPCVPHLMLG